jgi:6-phosphogluconolactonase (cycloisomerase 2 family)
MQFRFDAETGRLSANTPSRVEQPDLIGPRHYCFHPSLDIVYFSNEQGCSVSVYRISLKGHWRRCRRSQRCPPGSMPEIPAPKYT